MLNSEPDENSHLKMKMSLLCHQLQDKSKIVIMAYETLQNLGLAYLISISSITFPGTFYLQPYSSILWSCLKIAMFFPVSGPSNKIFLTLHLFFLTHPSSHFYLLFLTLAYVTLHTCLLVVSFQLSFNFLYQAGSL